jgi:hypothetical protein
MAEGEGDWNAKKHGPSKPRKWGKVHLCIDADTPGITAIEITGSRGGDEPMLPDLLDQNQIDEPIEKETADGGYKAVGCHAAIAGRSACAAKPSRRNARAWLENIPGVQARIETVCPTYRLGCTNWRRCCGYHRRSLIGAKMRCFKLLGVMARDFDRQVVELHIRAAILNPLRSFGAPQTQRVACRSPSKGETRPQADLCNLAIPCIQQRGLFLDLAIKK